MCVEAHSRRETGNPPTDCQFSNLSAARGRENKLSLRPRTTSFQVADFPSSESCVEMIWTISRNGNCSSTVDAIGVRGATLSGLSSHLFI